MANPSSCDRYTERLAARRDKLSPRMLRVADYIANNRAAVLSKSAVELAGEVGVSDATVIRTVQALGFAGLRDLKHLFEPFDLTAAKLAHTINAVQHDTDRVVSYVLDEHRQVLESLSRTQTRRAIGHAAAILAQARRVALFGIGASGLLADYAARLFARSGMPAYALNRTGILLAEQLLGMATGDALVVLTQQNMQRELHTTVQEATRLQVPMVVIAGKRNHPLATHAAQMIVLPRAKADGMSLHGPTLACLEMLMLGVAAHDPLRPVQTMERLLELRRSIRARK